MSFLLFCPNSLLLPEYEHWCEDRQSFVQSNYSPICCPIICVHLCTRKQASMGCWISPCDNFEKPLAGLYWVETIPNTHKSHATLLPLFAWKGKGCTSSPSSFKICDLVHLICILPLVTIEVTRLDYTVIAQIIHSLSMKLQSA